MSGDLEVDTLGWLYDPGIRGHGGATLSRRECIQPRRTGGCRSRLHGTMRRALGNGCMWIITGVALLFQIVGA